MRLSILALLMLAAVPQVAAAQKTTLAPGKPAIVVLADGTTVEGKLVTWSADAIAVGTDAGVRTMSLTNVRQVSTTRTHGLDWAKKGALWGSVLGVLAVAANSESDHLTSYLAGVVLLGAPPAFWGGIIGAYHQTQEVVYVNGSAARSVALAPIITPSRLGLTALLRW